MRRIDDHFTDFIFDEWGYLGPKRKKALEKSWAHFFRHHLLTSIPAQILASRFSDSMGRPSKEIYAMLGVLILQQVNNFTDQDTLHAFMFDQLWQYALDIHDQSDDSLYLCERTLRNYRDMLVEMDGAQELFAALTDTLLRHFHVPTQKQRLDSTHLFSNMKNLNRLGLFVETVTDFLQELRRAHLRLFKKHVPAQMEERYLGKKNGCFAQVKGDEARRTLEEVAQDVFFLVRTFASHRVVSQRQSFQLLQRLLDEQCEIQEEANEERVVLRESKKIESTSLQNPSDPDATYDGHKGKGYQAQIMETFQTEEEPTAPNLITYVEVEAAHESDGEAVLPAIAETKERGCAPEILVADTAYGSDDNVTQAAEEGVELIAPVSGEYKKAEEMLVLRDFTVDEESGEIVQCPAGHAPVESRTTEGGLHIARFGEEQCAGCEHREYCQAGLEGDHTMRHWDKQQRLEERRQREESAEFKEVYRMRSGIEATNSHLKCSMNYGRVRVRGLGRMRYVVTLKALGLNIMRCWRWAKKKGMPENRGKTGVSDTSAPGLRYRNWSLPHILHRPCPSYTLLSYTTNLIHQPAT